MKIFLDTNVLLKAFAKELNQNGPLPYFDSSYQLVTFEKCKFECYMAFRGVGGKKPDEGRGDWASRHLKSIEHPAQLSKIASKYFNGDTAYAAFSINHIEEEYYALDESLIKYIKEEDQNEFYEILKKTEELYFEKEKFNTLINEFELFLEKNNISILHYSEVFSEENTWKHLHFDEFCKNTVIPSEDLEIVYAALILKPKVFLTTDNKLKKLLGSLGSNLPLHYSNVILEKDFENFKNELNGKA
jgi:hypothetical protein